jgi:response regulator RpfG family c-di-GMP phosphodiesterase
MRIGREAGMDPEELGALSTAAMLHNLGAVERHESLLRAAVVLSPAERMLRQREASEAAGRILAGRSRDGIAEILRHQAEYWDGSGVPDGLKGERIPLGSRILSLANAYDALVHDRPHRPAYSAAEAIELIRARSEKQFDPKLVESLIRCLETAEVTES